MSFKKHEEGTKVNEVNVYFPEKGIDLSALDKGLFKCTSSETIEIGLLETTAASLKAMWGG